MSNKPKSELRALLDQLDAHAGQMYVFEEISAGLADAVNLLKAQPRVTQEITIALVEALARGMRDAMSVVTVQGGPITLPAVKNEVVVPPRPRPTRFLMHKLSTGDYEITITQWDQA